MDIPRFHGGLPVDEFLDGLQLMEDMGHRQEDCHLINRELPANDVNVDDGLIFYDDGDLDIDEEFVEGNIGVLLML